MSALLRKPSPAALAPQSKLPKLRLADCGDGLGDHDLRTRPRPCGYTLKRTLDVVLAGCALIAFSPLLFAAAVTIKLTSRGPVFYRQLRLGFGERPFTILKFRSMRVDADIVGPAFTSAGDPRITPVGRLLRKTSVDELPQLLNVLRGDMSLIGPRPYIGFELEGWSDDDRATRAALRPGISGMSQAYGRSANTADQSRSYDLQYAIQCSPFLDIKIIIMTLSGLIFGRGTN